MKSSSTEGVGNEPGQPAPSLAAPVPGFPRYWITSDGVPLRELRTFVPADRDCEMVRMFEGVNGPVRKRSVAQMVRAAFGK